MRPRTGPRPTQKTERSRTDCESPARRSKQEPTPEDERAQAENKAWDSLARYKFFMFGYWCATWVQMNRLCAEKADNPWQQLVALARRRTGHRSEAPRRRTR